MILYNQYDSDEVVGNVKVGQGVKAKTVLFFIKSPHDGFSRASVGTQFHHIGATRVGKQC